MDNVYCCPTGGLDLNTTQLECFLAVVNHLNFSRAAEQLRITQPAVSHQINTLEDELEVKLFHRTSKSVRLTEAGGTFIQYALEILKLSALSQARVKDCRENNWLRFGIGCRNFLELRFLEPVLARLREEMPQLLPVIRLVPFASLENLLNEGDVQTILTFQDHAPEYAVYKEFVSCPVVCVCSRVHPLAGAARTNVAQLRDHGKMAHCPPTVYPPALLQAQTSIIAGRGSDENLFCDDMEVVYSLVRSGYAFALVPDLPGAREDGLCYIPVDDFSMLSYGAAYLRQSLDPAGQKFLSILKEIKRPEVL